MGVETWTPDQIAYLKKLWGAGLSGRDIGQLMGMTKNQVIAKANRLKLLGRASPLKGGSRIGQPRSKPMPAVVRKPDACQWPHGDPGKPGFHFCGDPAVRGKPYCEVHCARAYVGRNAASTSG